MRFAVMAAGLALAGVPAALLGQGWEVGGAAGYGAFRDIPVSGPSGNATASFSSGYAFSAVAGNNMYSHLGGEARYTYRSDDMKISGSGGAASMGAESHAIHYDLLVHAAPRGAAIRPFAAAGAGVKIYRGTGTESSYQPLSNLLVLTRTREAKPLLSFGGGVKVKISKHALFRVDFRDYATPIPEKLLAPRTDTKLSGWVHDFVILVGISFTQK